MVLFWRIWVAVLVVTFAVLGLFVGLATLQFGSINSSLVGERLLVLAERTAAPFAAAVRIGLPLSAVRNANGLLERARQTDDAILAIHVHDREGRILFATMPSPPSDIPRAVLAAGDGKVRQPWHRELDGQFLGGVDIARHDGSAAGGIIVVYPDEAATTQVRAMLAELALVAIGVVLVAGVLGAAVLRWGLARPITHFERVDQAVESFERDAWHSAAGAPIEGLGSEPTGLRARLNSAVSRYRAAGLALENERERLP